MTSRQAARERSLPRWLARTTILQGVIATMALGPAAIAAAAPAAEPEPVLLFEHAGLDAMLVDEKDAALRDALAMLPDRLRELPNEVDDMEQIPRPILDGILTMLTSPGRMALTVDPDNQANGAMGLGLVASAGPMERRAASELDGVVRDLAREGMRGQEMLTSEQYAGMTEVATPPGPLRFGPREAPDGWRYEVHFAGAGDPDAAFNALPDYGEGVTPVMRARMDLEPASTLIDTLMGFVGMNMPEAGMGLGMLKETGLYGEDAYKMDMTWGYTRDRSVSSMVVSGIKPYARANGLSLQPLGADAFRMIPSDATVAGLSTTDLSSTIEMIEGIVASVPEAGEGLAEFERQTGVNLIDDVLKSFGSTFGYYMADSAGGAGILSTVAFVELSDSERFGEANERLRAFANAALGRETEGYVRGRAWSDEGSQLFTLSFPGLPIPVELTYALQGKWLVLALSPQAALTAVRQARGAGDAGLSANATFMNAMPRGQAMTAVSFVDTKKTMSRGYQYVALLGSAIRNGVQSPQDPERMPGMVVPPFAELADGARPMVQYSFWAGDDYVTIGEGDRSMLVNASGVMGALDPFMPLIGLGFAAMAAGQAREMRMYDDGFDF